MIGPSKQGPGNEVLTGGAELSWQAKKKEEEEEKKRSSPPTRGDVRVANFRFPNSIALYLSVFDLNSDEINHSVHYVHHILEQKKKSWK